MSVNPQRLLPGRRTTLSMEDSHEMMEVKVLWASGNVTSSSLLDDGKFANRAI
jgi:hypothetical protein